MVKSRPTLPVGSGLPGSGPLGMRKALDCSVLPACPDRRVLAVLTYLGA